MSQAGGCSSGAVNETRARRHGPGLAGATPTTETPPMEPPTTTLDLDPARDEPFRPPVARRVADPPSPPRRKKSGRWLLVLRIAVLSALLAPLLLVALWTAVPPVSTPMLLRWATGAPVVRLWRPIEEIDRSLVASVVASEDNGFCTHAGVDWDELRDVISTEGGPRRGASTITMQVAKNLFLWPGRSYVRKALEIPLALAIDLLWSKRRILEIYLNVAEWGPDGEFGIEAGTRRALGKGAGRLTAGEAALMTVMLPNPHTRDARRPTANLRRVAGIVRARAVGSPEFTHCIER